MAKAVLISIQPKWCELIAVGRKTLELRKSAPKIPLPFKCYIYQTKKNWIYKLLKRFSSFSWAQCVMNGQTKVIGEFTCDYIMRFCHMANADLAERPSCVNRKDIFEYSRGKEVFGWHISNLVIYDKPKELTEYFGQCDKTTMFDCSFCHEYGCKTCNPMTRPPQSWRYVEEL